jgi:acyl-[acyl-carrier-protein]-phospholipid O-acyltransferase/long-chain-fatty-acid--[acyl-carrier-protein] ligase
MKKKTSVFKTPSFFYLNISQFLSSFKDNFYKYLLIYSVIDVEGLSFGPFVLAASGIIFITPFILFSYYSGCLADRYSKRNLIVITKIIELFTVCLLFLSFLMQSELLRYVGLFILATEEAIISPSKYGIIPELVSKDQITEANGYLVSFSYTGMMLGALIASFLTQYTGHNYLFSSTTCIVTAAIALAAAIKIPRTPAYAIPSKIKIFFLGDIIRTVKNAAATPYLVLCMLGSAFFLFLAAFSQANIIPYSIYSLQMSEVSGGYFAFITTIGVCIGGIAAGQISGPRVALGLVPLAVLGMAICFFLFHFTVGMPLLTGINSLVIGIFAGLYLVPQDAYVQAASSNEVRGKNVATTNFFGWCSVLVASFAFYFMRHVADLSPQICFDLLGLLCLIALFFFTVHLLFPKSEGS